MAGELPKRSHMSLLKEKILRTDALLQRYDNMSAAKIEATKQMEKFRRYAKKLLCELQVETKQREAAQQSVQIMEMEKEACRSRIEQQDLVIQQYVIERQEFSPKRFFAMEKKYRKALERLVQVHNGLDLRQGKNEKIFFKTFDDDLQRWNLSLSSSVSRPLKRLDMPSPSWSTPSTPASIESGFDETSTEYNSTYKQEIAWDKSVAVDHRQRFPNEAETSSTEKSGDLSTSMSAESRFDEAASEYSTQEMTVHNVMGLDHRQGTSNETGEIPSEYNSSYTQENFCETVTALDRRPDLSNQTSSSVIIGGMPTPLSVESGFYRTASEFNSMTYKPDVVYGNVLILDHHLGLSNRTDASLSARNVGIIETTKQIVDALGVLSDEHTSTVITGDGSATSSMESGFDEKVMALDYRSSLSDETEVTPTATGNGSWPINYESALYEATYTPENVCEKDSTLDHQIDLSSDTSSPGKTGALSTPLSVESKLDETTSECDSTLKSNRKNPLLTTRNVGLFEMANESDEELEVLSNEQISAATTSDFPTSKGVGNGCDEKTLENRIRHSFNQKIKKVSGLDHRQGSSNKTDASFARNVSLFDTSNESDEQFEVLTRKFGRKTYSKKVKSTSKRDVGLKEAKHGTVDAQGMLNNIICITVQSDSAVTGKLSTNTDNECRNLGLNEMNEQTNTVETSPTMKILDSPVNVESGFDETTSGGNSAYKPEIVWEKVSALDYQPGVLNETQITPTGNTSDLPISVESGFYEATSDSNSTYTPENVWEQVLALTRLSSSTSHTVKPHSLSTPESVECAYKQRIAWEKLDYRLASSNETETKSTSLFDVADATDTGKTFDIASPVCFESGISEGTSTCNSTYSSEEVCEKVLDEHPVLSNDTAKPPTVNFEDLSTPLSVEYGSEESASKHNNICKHEIVENVSVLDHRPALSNVTETAPTVETGDLSPPASFESGFDEASSEYNSTYSPETVREKGVALPGLSNDIYHSVKPDGLSTPVTAECAYKEGIVWEKMVYRQDLSNEKGATTTGKTGDKRTSLGTSLDDTVSECNSSYKPETVSENVVDRRLKLSCRKNTSPIARNVGPLETTDMSDDDEVLSKRLSSKIRNNKKSPKRVDKSATLTNYVSNESIDGLDEVLKTKSRTSNYCKVADKSTSVDEAINPFDTLNVLTTKKGTPRKSTTARTESADKLKTFNANKFKSDCSERVKTKESIDVGMNESLSESVANLNTIHGKSNCDESEGTSTLCRSLNETNELVLTTLETPTKKVESNETVKSPSVKKAGVNEAKKNSVDALELVKLNTNVDSKSSNSSDITEIMNVFSQFKFLPNFLTPIPPSRILSEAVKINQSPKKAILIDALPQRVKKQQPINSFNRHSENSSPEKREFAERQSSPPSKISEQQPETEANPLLPASNEKWEPLSHSPNKRHSVTSEVNSSPNNNNIGSPKPLPRRFKRLARKGTIKVKKDRLVLKLMRCIRRLNKKVDNQIKVSSKNSIAMRNKYSRQCNEEAEIKLNNDQVTDVQNTKSACLVESDAVIPISKPSFHTEESTPERRTSAVIKPPSSHSSAEINTEPASLVETDAPIPISKPSFQTEKSTPKRRTSAVIKPTCSHSSAHLSELRFQDVTQDKPIAAMKKLQCSVSSVPISEPSCQANKSTWEKPADVFTKPSCSYLSAIRSIRLNKPVTPPSVSRILVRTEYAKNHNLKAQGYGDIGTPISKPIFQMDKSTPERPAFAIDKSPCCHCSAPVSASSDQSPASPGVSRIIMRNEFIKNDTFTSESYVESKTPDSKRSPPGNTQIITPKKAEEPRLADYAENQEEIKLETAAVSSDNILPPKHKINAGTIHNVCTDIVDKKAIDIPPGAVLEQEVSTPEISNMQVQETIPAADNNQGVLEAETNSFLNKTDTPLKDRSPSNLRENAQANDNAPKRDLLCWSSSQIFLRPTAKRQSSLYAAAISAKLRKSENNFSINYVSDLRNDGDLVKKDCSVQNAKTRNSDPEPQTSSSPLQTTQRFRASALFADVEKTGTPNISPQQSPLRVTRQSSLYTAETCTKRRKSNDSISASDVPNATKINGVPERKEVRDNYYQPISISRPERESEDNCETSEADIEKTPQSRLSLSPVLQRTTQLQYPELPTKISPLRSPRRKTRQSISKQIKIEQPDSNRNNAWQSPQRRTRLSSINTAELEQVDDRQKMAGHDGAICTGNTRQSPQLRTRRSSINKAELEQVDDRQVKSEHDGVKCTENTRQSPQRRTRRSLSNRSESEKLDGDQGDTMFTANIRQSPPRITRQSLDSRSGFEPFYGNNEKIGQDDAMFTANKRQSPPRITRRSLSNRSESEKLDGGQDDAMLTANSRQSPPRITHHRLDSISELKPLDGSHEKIIDQDDAMFTANKRQSPLRTTRQSCLNGRSVIQPFVRSQENVAQDDAMFPANKRQSPTRTTRQSCLNGRSMFEAFGGSQENVAQDNAMFTAKPWQSPEQNLSNRLEFEQIGSSQKPTSYIDAILTSMSAPIVENCEPKKRISYYSRLPPDNEIALPSNPSYSHSIIKNRNATQWKNLPNSFTHSNSVADSRVGKDPLVAGNGAGPDEGLIARQNAGFRLKEARKQETEKIANTWERMKMMKMKKEALKSYITSQTTVEADQPEVSMSSYNQSLGTKLNEHNGPLTKKKKKKNKKKKVKERSIPVKPDVPKQRNCGSYNAKLAFEAITAFTTNSTKCKDALPACLNVLDNLRDGTVVKTVVNIVMENVDEELDDTFTPPAPLLTKTQQRLLHLIVATPRMKSLSHMILNSIYNKIYPDKFFWPDDSVETSARFYTALSKQLGDDKPVGKLLVSAGSDMPQRGSLIVSVILQTWPEMIPKASSTNEYGLSATLVHLILQTGESKCSSRSVSERQAECLLSLKKQLKMYYEYAAFEKTTEKMRDGVLKSVRAREAGALEALVLLCSKGNQQWVNEKVIPSVLDHLGVWQCGGMSDDCAKDYLTLLSRVLNNFPLNEPDAVEAVKNAVTHLGGILCSNKVSHFGEERIVRTLLCLQEYCDVKQILSAWIPQEAVTPTLLERIERAVTRKKKPSPTTWKNKPHTNIKRAKMSGNT